MQKTLVVKIGPGGGIFLLRLRVERGMNGVVANGCQPDHTRRLELNPLASGPCSCILVRIAEPSHFG